MSLSCRGCGADGVREVSRFSDQPIASRFKQSMGEPEELIDLQVCGCPECGLVQLAMIPSVEALRPRFEWLRYNEPETHLDDVAATVAGLATVKGRVVGLTYKDNSFLERLEKLGFSPIRKDLASEALRERPAPWGVETVADWLSGGTARGATEGADVVVARHVLEHCLNPREAVGALLSWLGDQGLLFVEVPGCREALKRGIPELLWEEHASYFTESTFKRMLCAAGAEVVHLSEHAYPFESSLIAIVRPATAAPAEFPKTEATLAGEYGRQIERRIKIVARGLRNRKASGARTVIFGAGHLSCSLLALSGCSDCVECVLDDTPHKQGLFLAGTKLPIIRTDALALDNPGLCLMAVHPSVESRVHDRLAPLREAGWQTLSIFPDSPYAAHWD